jgi:hypothetical protein
LRPETRRQALLIGGAAVALVALAALAPPTVFEGPDWLALHLPNKLYSAEALRGGRLPLWNPYVSLGRPFLADIETAVLYPPNVLYLVLDPSTALLLLTLAHYVLGLAGALALGRALGMTRWAAWLVAACFLWAAPLVTRLSAGLIPYAQAICYLPLLMLLALRLQDAFSARRLAALAAALAFQLLCGHPQIAWVTWLGLGALLAGRALPPGGRPLRIAIAGLGGLALALLAALALTGPMLLPFLELVSQGNRATPSVTFASGGSLEWWEWTSLLMPDGGRNVFHWEVNLYAGLLPVLAGLAGLLERRDRNARGLLLMALVGALVAAGTRTPVFALLYHLVPGLSSFHIHSRAALLVVVALLMGAGLFLSHERTRGRTALALAVGVALVGMAPVLYRLGAPASGTAAEPALWIRPAIAVLAAVLIGVVSVLKTGRASASARLALALVVLADLGAATVEARRVRQYPVPMEGERALFETLLGAGLYDPSGVPPRIAVPPWIVRHNAALVYRWANVAGYNALTLDRVWMFEHATLGLEPSLDENTYPSPRLYEAGPFPWDSMNLVAGWEPREDRLVLRNPGEADPRAWLAEGARRVDDWREAVTLIAEGHDLHREPLVEARLEGERSGRRTSRDGGRAAILSFDPEHVVLETEAAIPSLLVLSEAWYPGWSASVDGAPALCFPANAWMRAVQLPAGHHRVELRFRSRLLLPGAWLSLATAAGLALAWRRGGVAGR